LPFFHAIHLRDAQVQDSDSQRDPRDLKMSTAKEQELKTEIAPPFVDIDGLANFRDIGGLPIESNNGNTTTVRKGVFYRGPDTSTVAPAGIAKLKELHVTTDFDLRSKGQIEKAGGATEMDGIQRIWCPAFPDGEYSPEKAAARYVQYASDGTEVGILLNFPFIGFNTQELTLDRVSSRLSQISSLMVLPRAG
jgi:hypothetical protein